MRTDGNYGNGWEKWEEMGAMRATEAMRAEGSDGMGQKKEGTLGGFLFFMGWDGIIQRGE